MSEEFNIKGYHPPEVVVEGECVNCNLCEMICPDFAIFCVPAGDTAAVEAVRTAATEDDEGAGEEALN
jgi:formate hydrogenlyase subunit 6/NADH:ubiquinone oxidoreductase subunit I